MSESARHHKRSAAGRSATCGVLTISDSRREETDAGGKKILEGLAREGHRVVVYTIVPDEPEQIEATLTSWIGDPEIRVVLTTGGTGISRRDTTIEVVRRLLDKPLDGFGELFRMLSWQEIGSPAMLSRAAAGLAGETFVFSMPGSPNAVALALDRLILPELAHLLWERSR